MGENFITVGTQVLELFILIAVGFLCGKTKMLNDKIAKGITDIVLYIVCPCVIIQNFIREFNPDMLGKLLITGAAALCIHVVSIVIAMLVFHDKMPERNRVYRFALIFSNCGYMSLPMQQAILGSDGVFFGAVYIVIFNIVMWTFGVWLSSGDKKSLSAKKILLNPCIIGMAIGLVIFLCSIPVPPIIAQPITFLANLNTPLPMMIVGYYLSQTKILDAFKDGKGFICVLFRLIVIPLLAFGGMMLCGIRGTVLITCVIAAAAPAAAATTMFAAKFDNDAKLSVNLVTLSTLLSVVTMPLIVGFANTVGG
ncbi:MAG: AEC family transporter [Acutalibacteraceae bacterium]|nr:AEC family transporter [Acutalibacteraceae bacterium]